MSWRLFKNWRALAIVASSMIGASIAHAQVAAPSLVPFTFVTENPAAMQWGSPSRVGLNVTQSQIVTDPQSVSDNFTGYGGGVRLVGPRFSFAAEGSHSESSNKPYSQSETQDYGAGALAVRLGDSFSLGLGLQHAQVTLWDPQSSILVQASVDQPNAGFTLRLGEWFFLGGGGGQNTVKITNVTGPSFSVNTTQDVYKYGAGIRTGGTILTHFEYYVVDNSKYADSTVSGGRHTSSTGVAELNLGGFLLAYSATHDDRESGFGSSDSSTADIGYAPYTGLTIVLHGAISKNNEPSGGTFTSITTTLYALAITYLFGD